MSKKIFIQLFLLLIILAISVIFFKAYFLDKKKIAPLDKNITNLTSKDKSIDDTKSNILHNIKYISKDKFGNGYVITSEVGVLSDDQSELILMTNVTATINLNNASPIKIFADKAIYNSINYDTNFYESVLVTYNEHTINSDNLNLDFEKSLATISNNIIYKNLNTELQADKVEIDLITKNSRIFMNNKLDKINIVKIN
jgi:lipopolysaccharide export system protein LptA